MDFTNEELYTIERTMDNLLAEHIKGTVQMTNILGRYDKGKKLLDKMFGNLVDTYDQIRTIITKCENLRHNKNKGIKQ